MPRHRRHRDPVGRGAVPHEAFGGRVIADHIDRHDVDLRSDSLNHELEVGPRTDAGIPVTLQDTVRRREEWCIGRDPPPRRAGHRPCDILKDRGFIPILGGTRLLDVQGIGLYEREILRRAGGAEGEGVVTIESERAPRDRSGATEADEGDVTGADGPVIVLEAAVDISRSDGVGRRPDYQRARDVALDARKSGPDIVVREDRIFEEVLISPKPDSAIAVLVCRESRETGRDNRRSSLPRDERRHVRRRGGGAIGPGRIVDEQSRLVVGVCRVPVEFPERGAVGTMGLSGGHADRGIGKRIPESDPLGPGGGIRHETVVWIGDPEGRRTFVARDEAMWQLGTSGEQPEIPEQPVARLGALLEEVPVTEMVVADISFDGELLGPMHRHAAVVAAPDGAVADELAGHRARQMPMDRVVPQATTLPHVHQFHPVHLGRRPGQDHDVPPQSIGGGGHAIHQRSGTLNGDVSGEQTDLRPLIDGPPGNLLDLAVVGKPKRLVQRERATGDGVDATMLRLQRIEPRGRDHDPIAHPPIDLITHGDGGHPGAHGSGEACPCPPGLAMD